MAPFYSYLKGLHEAIMKGFGLIPLKEEISKQPYIDRCVDISGNSNEDLKWKEAS